ncbi:MAG: DnaA N-terminal domain-containing protein, partial [Alphaproteobacteria bacterium]|nr:DnaA N-terminal domain-containing protein [Alphaproteobacteria bacterium]
RGHRRSDWAALWAARVQDRHPDVMRAVKAGVSFIAPRESSGMGRPQRIIPDKKNEDDQSARLHLALAEAVGEAVARQWFAPCAVIMADDALTVIAPTPFHADHVRQNFASAITTALERLGWSADRITVTHSASIAKRETAK